MQMLFHTACYITITLRSFVRESYDGVDGFSIDDTHTHPDTSDRAPVTLVKQDNFIVLPVNVEAPRYSSLEKQGLFALARKKAAPDHVNFLITFSRAAWIHLIGKQLTDDRMTSAQFNDEFR